MSYKSETSQSTSAGEESSPNLARRLVSSLLDFLLLIITGCVLFAFVAQPIAKNIHSYENNVTACQNIMLDSKLYEEKNGDIVKVYNANHSNEEIDNILVSFYEAYDNIENYNADKEKQIVESATEDDRLFYYDEASKSYMIVVANKDSESLTSWLKASVDSALVDVLQNTNEWIDAYVGMFLSLLFLFSLCGVGSSLIVYLLIPLCSKGRTFGHKSMGLCLLSDRKGNIGLNAMECLCRYICFSFINLAGGIFTLGLLPLVSLLFAMNGKNNNYFHGAISRTKLVDYQEKKTEELDSFTKKALGMEKDDYVVQKH
jgi:hypothetical protein